MCGIYATYSFGTATDAGLVFEGLKKMEYRGYDSWGIASITDDGSFQTIKGLGPVSRSSKVVFTSKCTIGHTRWATHGIVSKTNTHPHFDCKGRLAIVHNGVIENYTDLKKQIVLGGHALSSQTDTEVVAHLLEEKVSSNNERKVGKVFSTLEGKNAFVCVDTRQQKLYAYCQDMPLIAGLDKGIVHISSDLMAVDRSVHKFITLQNGHLLVCDKQGYRVFDTGTGLECSPKIENFERKFTRSGMKNNLLWNEIMEQKRSFSTGLETNLTLLRSVSAQLKTAGNILLLGCGSAYYAALFGHYFLSKTGLRSSCHIASQFKTFENLCNEKTIVIALSQSGETADTIGAVEHARSKGAKVVLLVNAARSRLEQLAHTTIPLAVGPELAVASTKAFTKQVYLLYVLARLISEPAYDPTHYADVMQKTITSWMNRALLCRIRHTANYIASKRSMFVIGNHEYYAAALEIALKLKENSLIHAEALAASELKHGPLSLIDEQTPVLAICSNNTDQLGTKASIEEIASRNGTVIRWGNDAVKDRLAIDLGPDTDTVGMLIRSVIAGQLLSYYTARYKGIDPDKPRNLAKSVTVM